MSKRQKSGEARFVKWFNPMLEALKQLGGSAKPREVTDKISEIEKLSEEQLGEILKSGVSRFTNEVAWARQYLIWEGLLYSPKFGVWALTEKGLRTKLTHEQSRVIFLKWVEIHAKANKGESKEEIIEEIVKEEQEIEPEKADTFNKTNILQVLQAITPKGFEEVCGKLLKEFGFENVEITQFSRDGGIDGKAILAVNPFVKMKLYFQCKRYNSNNKVTADHLKSFAYSILDKADRGIFITTSDFTRDAEEIARTGKVPIELINGQWLVEMFHEKELGVTPKTIYEVDLSFFEKYIDSKI